MHHDRCCENGVMVASLNTSMLKVYLDVHHGRFMKGLIKQLNTLSHGHHFKHSQKLS